MFLLFPGQTRCLGFMLARKSCVWLQKYRHTLDIKERIEHKYSEAHLNWENQNSSLPVFNMSSMVLPDLIWISYYEDRQQWPCIPGS